jgi:ribosome-associated heat shock protein Hsp15
VKPGERLTITIGEYVWEITVSALSARRGPASEARLLYEEDPASLARRQEAVARKRERRESRVRGDAVDRAKLRALKRGG